MMEGSTGWILTEDASSQTVLHNINVIYVQSKEENAKGSNLVDWLISLDVPAHEKLLFKL